MKVTVVFPVTFEIDFPENTSLDEKREKIIDKANYIVDSGATIKGIIAECTDKDLEE